MERRPFSVAGWASIALGLTYVLVGVAFLLQPEAQSAGSIDEFFDSYRADPVGFTMLQWATTIGGLFALAAVPAIAGLGNRAWSGWARNLGLFGFAVAIINSIRALELIPIQASDLVHSFVTDPTRMHIPRMVILGDNLHMSLDPNGWITYGGVGLFVLITVITAMRMRTIPRTLAIIGVGAATGYFLVVAGEYIEGNTLTTIAAAVGGVVLGPVFYVWSGLHLMRREPETV